VVPGGVHERGENAAAAISEELNGLQTRQLTIILVGPDTEAALDCWRNGKCLVGLGLGGCFDFFAEVGCDDVLDVQFRGKIDDVNQLGW